LSYECCALLLARLHLLAAQVSALLLLIAVAARLVGPASAPLAPVERARRGLLLWLSAVVGARSAPAADDRAIADVAVWF